MTTHLAGPTWTSTHIYGQGLKNISRQLSYYCIPKCASMWMRLCLSLHGKDKMQDRWEYTCFVDEPLHDYRKIIVLRDPVERWISNCPALDVIDQIAQDQTAVRNMFDGIQQWQYDEHAAPQFDFVNGLDLTTVVWFRCDKDLSTNIEHFFSCEKFDYQVPSIINQQSQDERTNRAAGIWRRLLQDPENLQKFQAAYKKDYDLIDSVRFYNHKR